MTHYKTEFTGKEIERAIYTNPSHDTIRVEYYDDQPSGKVLLTYLLPADPEHYSMKSLFAEGYDFERIQRETTEFNMQQSLAFNIIVKREAETRIQKVVAALEQRIQDLVANGTDDIGVITQSIVQKNNDDDQVLRAKMTIFEMPAVNQIDNIEVKAKLRNAITLLELYGALHELLSGKV